MTCEDSIHYAYRHDIPIKATKEKVYSIDDNLWGRAIECGEMEDPWAVPPPGVWLLTKPTATEPRDVVIGFERGMPVEVDGERLGMLDVIQRLNDVVGAYGMWVAPTWSENRLGSGIKSRGDLRMSGQPGVDPGAQGSRVDLPGTRPRPREVAYRATLRRADLRRRLWFSPAQAEAFGPRSSSRGQEFVTGE